METPGHGIDKRLSRIDRWLKRCMAACRCGSWSSALMEIECMEAEARECRETIWGIAADEAEGRRSRPRRAAALLGARAALLALVIVMAAGFPLSVDQDLPFEGFSSYGASSVALLTSTESDILEALRESLSDRGAGRVVLTIDRPEERTASLAGAAEAKEPAPGEARAAALPLVQPAPRSAGAVKSADAKAPALPAAPPPAKAAAEAEPSLEEVISLIQVGQRALRGSEPAVRVVRP